jgi:hypothetical protein
MKMWILIASLVGVFVLALVTPGVITDAFAQADDDDDATNPAGVDAATEVKKKYEGSLLSTGSVIGVGIGDTGGGRVGIHVFVKQGDPRPAIPSQLDGVPVKVIESPGFVAHVPTCDNPPFPCHTAIEALPVRLGTSIGNVNGNFAGTIGYRVRRIGPVATSEVGYITNNHVGSASGASLCPM